MVFDCTGCGSCCRRVGKFIGKLKELGFPYEVKEDGSCEMLGADNKCKVYDSRPDVCSVEKMYETVHSKTGATKKEIFKKEAEICNSFIKEEKLDDKFLIDINQYS